MEEKQNSGSPRKRRVLLGCTGSVASLKVPKIVADLVQLNLKVRVIVTKKSVHFFDPQTLPGEVEVLTDEQEWLWKARGDPVLHIELRKWADLMLIAPLDANTLAKIACGICDNLLTCVVRAWDMQRPLLFAPAMNTFMWDHPLTSQQIQTLTGWGFTEIPTIVKTLVCGDTGAGAMAEVETIINKVSSCLGIT